MSNCADCGVSFSEVKNHILLSSNIQDISKYDEHIYSWIIGAEQAIATYNGLDKIRDFTITNTPPSTKTPLPDNLYMLESVKFDGHTSVYTAGGMYYNRDCGCNTTPCICVKWYQNGCYIYSSVPVENVTINYQAFPIDEEGYPYVRQSHLEAIIAYIKYMLLQARYDVGKVQKHVYKTRYNEWLKRRDDARAQDEVPNDNEMARLAAIWNSKLPIHYKEVE